MSDLRDLYQEVILDHSKRPHNFEELAGANHRADGYNPLCGDRATIYLEVEGDTLRAASFLGNGCAISTASASIMTDVVRGKSVKEVDRLFGRFHELMTAKVAPAGTAELGKLAVFAGVREYPARVKCATLAWHTLRAALDSPDGVAAEPVTTEAGDTTR